MNDAYRTFASTRHFSGLDALRAISVLGVIWSHVTAPHGLRLLNQGHMGVDLFFAISGFLVTTLLLREYRQAGHISLRNFYIRRTLRIFPLYYVVLALYCVLVFATMRGTPKAAEFWQNLPSFATYTSNWFVNLAGGTDKGVTFYFAWSLATEEQFYLFWPPLLVLLLCKSSARWVPALAAMALLTVQFAASTSGSGGLLSTILGSLAPAILFGAAFAVLLDSPRIYAAVYPVLGHRAAAPVALVALLTCLQLGAPGLATRFVMALLVTTLCVREDTVLHPVLRWRPAVAMGTISYGIYLMHMLAANAVRKVLGHPMGLDVFVLTTLVVFAIAWLSFRYFESPVMRLKNRFQAARPDGPRATSAAVGTVPITDIHLPGRHHA